MEASALRPLGVGEILDVAFKIYKRHAVPLFKIVLPPRRRELRRAPSLGRPQFGRARACRLGG